MRLSSKEPLIVKCSGGKAAQILALINAIYLSKKIGVDFKLVYFPHSTGTFWEFGLEELLYEKEVYEIRNSPGIDSGQEIAHGTHIPNFPTRRGGFNYLKAFQLLNRLGLVRFLSLLRRERVVAGSRRRLDQVTRRTRMVSGNFVPILENEVYVELESRLGGKVGVNPFSTRVVSNFVVIHYRLGDMRIDPLGDQESQESRVVDPQVFRDLLKSVNFDFEKECAQVISDEPKLAAQLLLSVGVNAMEAPTEFGFWQDLNIMSSAKVFIGSLSQMSFLGGSLCLRHGGQVFLPGDAFGEVDIARDIGIQGFNFYSISYLNRSHWIFK